MNKASETSMRQALYMAIDIYKNRQAYLQYHANPLKKQYYDKGVDADVSLIAEVEKEESTL
jgi:4-hydroxythreonine-4-phosphate dehydrogenase